MAVDILILSNAPGELATWVKPTVRELRAQLGSEPRISIVLSPCPNASGQEADIARSYPEVDRVQAAEHFFTFLLRGKTADNWDWHDRGVVIFLGGDQFFPVVIGKRLGYRTVIYAEWEARWHRWIDRFGVMRSEILDRAPVQFRNKISVVGDLMSDVQTQQTSHSSQELIGLLPGSKPAKLMQGVPIMMAIVEEIQRDRPHARFVALVAPTLDLPNLVKYADREQNPIMSLVGDISGQLVEGSDRPILKTQNGVEIELWQSPSERVPAYELLAQCQLCITTIGANTAELGSLAVPMIVIAPTQQIDAMRAWDGALGLLVNLPGIGSTAAKVINSIMSSPMMLKRLGFLAWPNIWAKEMIVPELIGKLQPKEVADLTIDYLEHPEKLDQMRDRLRQVRGEPGAAKKLVAIVAEEILKLDQ